VSRDDITGHAHSWAKPYVFRDHCHYVVIEKTCTICGEVNETASDRDFDLNPLQIAFARQDCARCQILAKGHEPASWGAHA
jgi:hypothetical protein